MHSGQDSLTIATEQDRMRLERASHYPLPFMVDASDARRMMLALEGAELGISDYVPRTGEMWISDSMLAIQGFTREEAMRHPDYPGMFFGPALENPPYIHPDDLELVAHDRRQRITRPESGPFETEFRIKHKDGRWVWVFQRVRVVEIDEYGMAARLVGIRSDITERKTAQLALESAKGEINEAELRALRYQVNPHFLFNSLGAIATLIIDGATKQAEQMVLGLASFYRASLQEDPLVKIPLEQEMQLQSQYLQIEKARFPDELEVQIDVPPELRQALIPCLLTQPLIENSIKYGLRAAGQKMRLQVRARRKGGRVEIKVEDDGRGSGAPSGTGIGLGVTKRRLAATYGEHYSFEAGPRKPHGFTVRLIFPFETEDHG